VGDEKKKRGKHKTAGKPLLCVREVRFCAGYADHENATRAHREAGYEAASENAHSVAGKALLRKPQIRAKIREMQEEAADVAQATVNKIAQALYRIAFCDRTLLFDERGCLLPRSKMPGDVRATIESIENEELLVVVSKKGEPRRRELMGFARKVKTAKRTEAIKLLMQWKRMIGQDAEGTKAPPAPLVISGDANPDNL
jgi:phage terminase small subunit